MSTPYEWRINDIERDAKMACDQLWRITAHDGYIDSLQHSVRELSSCVDGLRCALEASLSRIEQLERTIEEMKPTIT